MQAKRLGPGKHNDGQNLWLHKRTREQGKWFVRLVVAGKRREMGLGPWPDVTLAEARERAAAARKMLRAGKDPIEERSKLKHRPQRVTVAEAIDGCFKARQAELKNDGKAGNWLSPLRVHVLPKIGQYTVEDIDQHLLKRIFEPIWHTKPDAARKAANRLNLTLQYAAALDLDVDLQAVAKMKALLGKQRHRVTHIPSLPYQDAPAFYQMLCSKKSVTALALRFLMLTVARSAEVRFARFNEIEEDIWILSQERTKTAQEHRVPLSDEAQAVVQLARQYDNELLFPSPSGKALSDAAMSALMKKAGLDARPHGFRSTFRTWAENETDADWETKEGTLGHRVGSTVERSYQRSDRIEKRLLLLDSWSARLRRISPTDLASRT